MRCNGNMKIYLVTAWLRVNMEDKGFIQSLSRGRPGSDPERADLEQSTSSHWRPSLHCLEDRATFTHRNTAACKAHAKGCQVVEEAASEHPQKAQWFSSIATWGMLTIDKLQKPQLSENGPIPWKHLCSQTVNDKGGNALQPSQQFLICWACVRPCAGWAWAPAVMWPCNIQVISFPLRILEKMERWQKQGWQ